MAGCGGPNFDCIHEVSIRVANAEAPAVHCLGLPHGQEFATTEGDAKPRLGLAQVDPSRVSEQLRAWTS